MTVKNERNSIFHFWLKIDTIARCPINMMAKSTLAFINISILRKCQSMKLIGNLMHMSFYSAGFFL